MCILNYLLILMVVGVKVESFLSDIEDASARLDKLLVDVKTQRFSRDSVENIDVWQEYEFGTGVGNREELLITNITVEIDPLLSDSIYNYQYVDRDGEYFLAGASDHIFSLYKLDLAHGQVTFATDVHSDEKIITFTLLSLPNSSESKRKEDTTILAILCVESGYSSKLLWYRFNGKELVQFQSWPPESRVEQLLFYHHDKQNRLVLLREEVSHSGQPYSAIDIYNFSIVGERLSLWSTQRETVPKTFDLQVCQTYESTVMVLQLENDVAIWEYTGDKHKESLFKHHQNVTSNGLRNVVCFESGYIRYLVTSGPEAALFDYFENEFEHDTNYEDVFNDVGEVSWIQSLPVDTYREETILLVQLKNLSIIVLSWNGQGYEKTPLPGITLENLDLSKITVIPKYGFVYGDILVKVETTLREKPRPARDEIEKMLQTRQALEELLRKQELILDETEIRINESYLVNPNVTGFWNLTEVEADSVIIEDGVSIDEITIGTKKIELDELLSDPEAVEADNVLSDLESKLQEIRANFAKSVLANSTEVTLAGDLIIDGGFDVRETLSVKNFTFDHLNRFSLDEILNDLSDYDENLTIEGFKTFESIDAENLIVGSINGVPISDVLFDIERRDYSNVDFAKVTKLRIEGNLNFTDVHDVNWKQLMNKIVLKSESTTIPGVTTVEGDLIANHVNIDRLNGLQYPEDYILAKSTDTVLLSGEKEFDKLTVGNLDVDYLKTINGVPIEDYITLRDDRTLTADITFENLIITEKLIVDGQITGLLYLEKMGPLINETSTIVTDVVIDNLKIVGEMEVESSLNGTSWSELDDLISKDDKVIVITGHKTFLSEVEVGSKLVIENQRINGHAIDEFVTLDTDQVFPNLERISGNVTFGQVTRGDLESLKEFFTEDLDDYGQPNCLSQLLVFRVSPIVDRLFIGSVNGNITAHAFSAGLNKTFANISFQNLEVPILRAHEILPVTLNGQNFEDLKNKRISKTGPQTLTGNYEIEELEARLMTVGTMDGMTVEQLETFRTQLEDLYNRIINGSVAIDSLTVTGSISALNINEKPMQNIYDPETMGTVIFAEDVLIENLNVLGLINGINFTNYVNDSVQKTDTNITITGPKTFNKIVCEILEASNLNGRSVDYILDPDKHQVLTGSMKVNGTVRILEEFETQGKIGGISWQGIQERFHYLGNNTYLLNGDVRFTSEDIEIQNLVADSVQGIPFDDFLQSVVYKNSKNITINGPLVFNDVVTINSPFTITESFNDLDLKYFYDHAVRIDQPFLVKSKVVFTENIAVEQDLIVDDQIKAKAVGGVNLEELYNNAAFIDRPTAVLGTTVLENVVFESDIAVETLNEKEMTKVITLKGEQNFDSTLHCLDIAVGQLKIGGRFNEKNLYAIYDDTFMLNGPQNVTGHINFRGNVHVRHNFDARLINGVDPTTMISLDGNDSLIGNFVFAKPIVLHGNYEASDTVNDIDLMKWQATVVTKNFPIRQIVKGSWTIHGNVHFRRNVDGSDFLDGVNVTALVDDLHRDDVETDLAMKNVKDDLHSTCEDLSVLKHAAEHQIYKYKYFEYLQVLNFDRSIVSVHQFESDDFDYLLVNYDTCHLDIFVFTGTEFIAVTSVSNIGNVERWFTMHFEGETYFLTVGKYACNRSNGNLWKLSNDQFVHVEDLRNVTDAKKVSETEFLVIVDGLLVRHSILKIHQRSLSTPPSYQTGGEDVKFIRDAGEVLLVDRDYLYRYEFENETGKQLVNCFGANEISSFRLGIYEREVFVYHDDNLSEEYLFISENNVERHKILQTIRAQRPSSMIVINFDGLVENFLIFIENLRSLQIYEYRGIEGFIHRETIKMNVEKIFKLKLRRYSKLAKKHCIAAIQGNRLVILEAKMYGERLDMGPLPCEN